ncbi:hypothetical protein LWC34_30270 [Kibdelosporangium philippinense]|uniref:IrrE N-terminal-like domain-containing protein n=1 Tax=Kibdelosporangium philippinense TaxID=211113 RepID=A0ABS8ZHP8_9PSEU|nr:hypothetical protein [Kibdelosporangium philippinense]MCE7007082.1 hypothetical protein [Kibdelosporangium philippinense]
MTRTSGRRASTTRRKAARYSLSPEQRTERLSVAREQLLDGVNKLMTAEGWQQLITSRAWLRRYSLNNLIMILQQCPQATDVRPMSEWKKAGYEYMRKGTHKIKIWKPNFRKIEADQTDDSNSTGDVATTQLSGFMLVPVVDVSQLQGGPAVEPPVPPRPVELAGEAPSGLWEGVAEQITACGFAVERGDCDGAYGVTRFAERRVIVRGDVEPAQAAKTLTHELAHILCEHEARARTAPRHLQEVEAESVACIVSAVCGVDTLTYSVPYVAGWAADLDTAHQSAERVLQVADAILSRLDRVSQSLDEDLPVTTVTDAVRPQHVHNARDLICVKHPRS